MLKSGFRKTTIPVRVDQFKEADGAMHAEIAVKLTALPASSSPSSGRPKASTTPSKPKSTKAVKPTSTAPTATKKPEPPKVEKKPEPKPEAKPAPKPEPEKKPEPAKLPPPPPNPYGSKSSLPENPF
jgi:outer membrane biosynthesis protein TonB